MSLFVQHTMAQMIHSGFVLSLIWTDQRQHYLLINFNQFSKQNILLTWDLSLKHYSLFTLWWFGGWGVDDLSEIIRPCTCLRILTKKGVLCFEKSILPPCSSLFLFSWSLWPPWHLFWINQIDQDFHIVPVNVMTRLNMFIHRGISWARCLVFFDPNS